MPKYDFVFYKAGPNEEDCRVEAGSALELLDAFLSWPYFEEFSGLAHGYNGSEHFGWTNPVDYPTSNSVGDVPFDVDRLHDLEYVEMMVAELWARVERPGEDARPVSGEGES